MEYERYLYSLEWINLQVGSEVDPAVGTVLGLLAISVLL